MFSPRVLPESCYWNRTLSQEDRISFIHNHPNNTGASLADLSAAVWLGADLLIVVNPDGRLHRYARRGDETAASKEPAQHA